jgi:hypothetical protein
VKYGTLISEDYIRIIGRGNYDFEIAQKPILGNAMIYWKIRLKDFMNLQKIYLAQEIFWKKL